MLPEITLWRGRQSHILLSTWVPGMGFLLSECELQAILLIHERYVTLFINSVTYRYAAVWTCNVDTDTVWDTLTLDTLPMTNDQ
jgi:hypothetical protein